MLSLFGYHYVDGREAIILPCADNEVMELNGHFNFTQDFITAGEAWLNFVLKRNHSVKDTYRTPFFEEMESVMAGVGGVEYNWYSPNNWVGRLSNECIVFEQEPTMLSRLPGYTPVSYYLPTIRDQPQYQLPLVNDDILLTLDIVMRMGILPNYCRLSPQQQVSERYKVYAEIKYIIDATIEDMDLVVSVVDTDFGDYLMNLSSTIITKDRFILSKTNDWIELTVF